MLTEELINDPKTLLQSLIVAEVRAEKAESQLENREYVWVVEHRSWLDTCYVSEVAHVASSRGKARMFMINNKDYASKRIDWFWAVLKVGIDRNFSGINIEYYDKRGAQMESQPL